MFYPRPQAADIYRRFVNIFGFSIVGFILAGVCLIWAVASYSSAEAQVQPILQKAALYAGSWVDDSNTDSNTIYIGVTMVAQLQISVSGTTLTVQGIGELNDTLAPNSGTYTGDPFSIELTSSQNIVYNLQLSLNNSQGTAMSVVVSDSNYGDTSTITMVSMSRSGSS